MYYIHFTSDLSHSTLRFFLVKRIRALCRVLSTTLVPYLFLNCDYVLFVNQCKQNRNIAANKYVFLLALNGGFVYSCVVLRPVGILSVIYASMFFPSGGGELISFKIKPYRVKNKEQIKQMFYLVAS